MKLVLFDIDGTILRTRGVGLRALETALSSVCGRPIDAHIVPSSGKTDPQIVVEVLEAHGYQRSLLDGLDRAGLEAYRQQMEQMLSPANVHVLPGVPELIAFLHAHDDVQLGLLTGNLEPLAYRKLELVGLDAYFPLGAFGSDNADRYQLPAIAIERAFRHTGRRFEGTEVVIIGDTEHDIGCGRGIGAFCVAVCTGTVDRACLMAHNADVLFERLDDPESFASVVLRG
jgi:phosphoglycolate phosphatase